MYGCSCTRQEIAATGSGATDELRYPGTCRERGLAIEDGRGWRVRMEPGAETFVDGIRGPASQEPSRQCGDLLVRDRLGNWTYQFAAAIDDYLQDISHVIRGVDLFPSTGRQIRLARLAGRETPAIVPPPRTDHAYADPEAEQVGRGHGRRRPPPAGVVSRGGHCTSAARCVARLIGDHVRSSSLVVRRLQFVPLKLFGSSHVASRPHYRVFVRHRPGHRPSVICLGSLDGVCDRAAIVEPQRSGDCRVPNAGCGRDRRGLDAAGGPGDRGHARCAWLRS